MNHRICTHVVRHAPNRGVLFPTFRAAFSVTAAGKAQDPQTELLESLSPAKASRPRQTPVPSRDPAFPSDDSNPLLNNFPKTQGNRTSAYMMDTLSNFRGSENPARRRMQDRKKNEQERKTLKMLEQQMRRRWEEGDVYSPHDLSSVEQVKTRRAKVQFGPGLVQDGFSRNSRERDYLDEFNVDMRQQYTNPAMLSEFVSETGRIKGRKETKLRPINQRRMAKAVRRAIAFGLMPSTHKHPETFAERRRQINGQLFEG